MRPVVWSAVWLFVLGTCLGTELTLKDGRVLQGKLVPLVGLAEKAELFKGPDSVAVPMIHMLDDDLRRTYVGRWQIVPGSVRPEEGEALERFKLKQRTAHSGMTFRSLGPLFDIQPFDEYGRRRLKMVAPRVPQELVQAITEITPHYTKLEAEKYVWDMRIATSSIPRANLDAILRRTVAPTNVEERKRIARFYMQCERYEDAAREVEGILADNPDNPEAKKQLDPALTAIRQLSARRTLEELKLRQDAGQHRMVLALLKKFPSEGPAGETIQAVREMLRDYEAQEATRVKVLERFDQLAAKIDDSSLRKRIDAIREELSAELSLNTLARMAAFRQMADDENLKPEEKLALAISGWLVDSKGATTKLSTALSLVRVRVLVRKYLAAADKLTQAKILSEFSSEEGAAVELVARLLANMKPPLPAKPTDEAGLAYELDVPGPGSLPAVRCLVQLPPEYDPYRRYPAIVSLHGAGTSPEMQVEWWAGAVDKQGQRAGQAARRGYIVIAPAWTAEHQKQYGYSLREHTAVLDCLHAACRRFSVDTDRVFLTGHSIGGDAAWDIALAHPDLWAGMVAIGAKGDKYVNLYWENGRLLPMYFVCGELDGTRDCKANALDWNRYLRTNGFNATVVEYLGRGHEHFSDEILRLFDWMGRMRRNFFPREFSANSMRTWDNFFWWVELEQLPARAMIDPDDWPASRRNIKAIVTKASITKTDTIHVQSGAGRVIVWLSPDMIDLKRRITVTIDGARIPNTAAVVPDLAMLLEDARTRADRQHPFWAKVEKGGGRAAASP
jgi:pimeloyl-ACP methyl ester carboxylesterase